MGLSLTVIIVIVAVFIALKFARKFTSKILSVIIVVGIVLGYMYHNSMGPFKTNVADIEHLKEKYCGPDGDLDICECILKPAEDDLSSRFTPLELDSLSQKRIKAAYVLKKSLNATKEQALICLAAKDATSKYKVFLQDFVPIENKYLDMVGDKAKELESKLKDEVRNFQKNKDDIDSKY